jgi:hypothetical protein
MILSAAVAAAKRGPAAPALLPSGAGARARRRGRRRGGRRRTWRRRVELWRRRVEPGHV